MNRQLQHAEKLDAERTHKTNLFVLQTSVLKVCGHSANSRFIGSTSLVFVEVFTDLELSKKAMLLDQALPLQMLRAG